jgi:hypothetical protein
MARLTKDEKLMLTLYEYDERDAVPNRDLMVKWSKARARGKIIPFPHPKAVNAITGLYKKGLLFQKEGQ